jgi:hypothetical protein
VYVSHDSHVRYKASTSYGVIRNYQAKCVGVYRAERRRERRCMYYCNTSYHMALASYYHMVHV